MMIDQKLVFWLAVEKAADVVIKVERGNGTGNGVVECEMAWVELVFGGVKDDFWWCSWQTEVEGESEAERGRGEGGSQLTQLTKSIER
jgi:hypothetical protein